MDHPAIGGAVVRSCLVPLDRHLDGAALAEQVEGSVGRSAESYEWDGHRWALATDAAAQVAAYRPDLLERAGVALPRTWPEALDAAAALLRPRHDGFLAFQDAAGDPVRGHLLRGRDPDLVLEAVDAAYQDSYRNSAGAGGYPAARAGRA